MTVSRDSLRAFQVYGTMLASADSKANGFARIADYVQLAERHGLDGLLTVHNSRNHDPWAVAAAILQSGRTIIPLVAVQPYAMPPATAARLAFGLISLYGRRIDINVVTGAEGTELGQVCDSLNHDERYERAVEYVQVFSRLLSRNHPLTHDGRFYKYRGLTPLPVAPHLRPRVFVAGSSTAAQMAVREVGDVAVTHPEPVALFSQAFKSMRSPSQPLMAIRIGIIARSDAAQAWSVASNRYVLDRRSHIMTMLRREAESDWSRRLARLGSAGEAIDEVYWAGAFISDRGSMPLLVGEHVAVADYLLRYIRLGVQVILLGGMEDETEFSDTESVIKLVRAALVGGSQ